MLLFLFLFLSSLLVQVTVRTMLCRTVRVSTITNLTLTKDSWHSVSAVEMAVELNKLTKLQITLFVQKMGEGFCITRGGVEEKDRGTVPGTV